MDRFQDCHLAETAENRDVVKLWVLLSKAVVKIVHLMRDVPWMFELSLPDQVSRFQLCTHFGTSLLAEKSVEFSLLILLLI